MKQAEPNIFDNCSNSEFLRLQSCKKILPILPHARIFNEIDYMYNRFVNLDSIT